EADEGMGARRGRTGGGGGRQLAAPLPGLSRPRDQRRSPRPLGPEAPAATGIDRSTCQRRARPVVVEYPSSAASPPATAGSFDAHPLPSGQLAGRLARQHFLAAIPADQQVPASCSRTPAVRTPRGGGPAFRLDGQRAVGERLDLPD